MSPAAASPTPSDWQVICLCAAWCGTCREWQGLFEQAAREHPHAQFHWIDVEDEADTLGEVDIETFPTLLIARLSQPCFYGPVPPLAGQLSRLLQRLLDDPRAGAPVAPEAGPLLARATRLLLAKR